MAKNDYAGKLIRSRKYAAQRQWQAKLEELFGTPDDRKLPGALSLQVNTMQRNVEKTFGKELGKKINEELFNPILENSAEKIRFINRMFDRVRGFDLSESESALVQRVIEGTAAADQVSKLDPDMRNEHSTGANGARGAVQGVAGHAGKAAGCGRGREENRRSGGGIQKSI